jgi:hypothetical protein
MSVTSSTVPPVVERPVFVLRKSASYNLLLGIPCAAEEEAAAAQDVADVLVNPEGR